MKIKIISRDINKTISLKGKTLANLFKEQKILGENFVASRKNQIILEDEVLKNNDVIELHPVVSGG